MRPSGRSEVRARLPKLAALIGCAVAILWPRHAVATPLKLWHAYRGDEEKALLEIVKGFTEEKVEVLALPADALDSKLASASLVGEGPDVLIAEHHHLGEYRARGIVAPIGDAYEGDAAFIGPAVSAVRDAKGVWGAPISPKCMALYVNDALVQRTPADIEGIAEMKSSLPNGVFPLVYEARNTYAHAALFGAWGGELLTKDDQFGLFGQGAEASLTLALGFLTSGAVPDDASYNVLKELFKANKAAFVISGPWLAAELSDAKDLRYHIEVLPKVRAIGQPMRPLLTVETVMLTKGGAERREARALARLIASRESSELRARVARSLTARADVVIPESDQMLRAFAEQSKVSVPMPASQAMQVVWEPANRAIESSWAAASCCAGESAAASPALSSVICFHFTTSA